MTFNVLMQGTVGQGKQPARLWSATGLTRTQQLKTAPEGAIGQGSQPLGFFYTQMHCWAWETVKVLSGGGSGTLLTPINLQGSH